MGTFEQERGIKPRDPSLPPKPPSARHLRIYEMSQIQQLTHEEIAKKYRKITGKKISRRRITQIIAKVRPWAFQQTMENIIDIRLGLTAQCNTIIRDCWKSWLESRQDAVTRKHKFTASNAEVETMLEYGHNLNDVEREEVRSGQCGDTRYLNTILESIKQIRSMWAIDEKHKDQLPNLMPTGPLVQVNNGNPQAMITIVEIPDNGRDPEIVAEYRREDEMRRKQLNGNGQHDE